MIVKGFDAAGEPRIWEGVAFKAVRPGDCIYLDGHRHQVVAVDENNIVYVGRPMPITLTDTEQQPSTLRHRATPEGTEMTESQYLQTEKQPPARSTRWVTAEDLVPIAQQIEHLQESITAALDRPVVPQAIAEQLTALHHETARLRRRVGRLEQDERRHTHDGHNRALLNGIYCEPHHSGPLYTRYWLRRPGEWLLLWPRGITSIHEPSGPVFRLTEDKRHAARS